MRHKTLAVDLGIALALAACVLILAPGVAIDGLIAIAAGTLCAISYALEARFRRSRRVPPAQRRYTAKKSRSSGVR